MATEFSDDWMREVAELLSPEFTPEQEAWFDQQRAEREEKGYCAAWLLRDRIRGRVAHLLKRIGRIKWDEGPRA